MMDEYSGEEDYHEDDIEEHGVALSSMPQTPVKTDEYQPQYGANYSAARNRCVVFTPAPNLVDRPTVVRCSLINAAMRALTLFNHLRSRRPRHSAQRIEEAAVSAQLLRVGHLHAFPIPHRQFRKAHRQSS